MEDLSAQDDKKKELQYIKYICENTPWFLGGAATCFIDLPNIEQIATGSYKKKIELWELRTENNKIEMEMDERGAGKLTSSKDKNTKRKGGTKSKLYDDIMSTDE